MFCFRYLFIFEGKFVTELTVQFTVLPQELTPIPHSKANQHYGAGVQTQNMIHAGN